VIHPYPATAAPRKLLLGTAALVLGTVIALLPLESAVLALGLGGLAVLALIEPLGAVVVLLVVAPTKALIETEAVFSLPVDIGQITLAIVFGAWLLNRLAQHRRLAWRFSWVMIPLLWFIAAALLSLTSALSISKGLAESLKWIEMLALVIFCLAAYRRSEIPWLVFAVVVAGGVQAIVGIYEFLGGSGAEHLLILDGRFYRAFGTFGQPNPFGAFMGITLLLAAGTAWGYTGRVWQVIRRHPLGWRGLLTEDRHGDSLSAIFYLAMTALLAVGLLVSWSRGAWMGFAGAAVVMVLFVPRSLVRGFILVVFIGVAGLLAWNSGLLPDALTARLSGFVSELTTIVDVRGTDVTDSNYAVTERIAHWQSAAIMAEDHPWLGVGFGNYEVAYPDYALMNWPQALGHAHNYYLNLLAEVGVIGLTAYLIMWTVITGLTIRLWKRSEGLVRAWSVALLGIWTYLTIHSMVDKLYVNNMFLHIGCTLGLLALLIADNKTLEPNHDDS